MRAHRDVEVRRLELVQRRLHLRQNLLEVLVAAAGEAEQHELLLELGDPRERVGGLERGNDSLGARQAAEGGERLLVGGGDVLGAAVVAQRGVLRARAGVVEPGRDRLGVQHLAVLVGEDGRARAVEDRRPAGAQAGGSARLHAEQAHAPRRRGSPRRGRSRSSPRRRTRPRPRAAGLPPRAPAPAPPARSRPATLARSPGTAAGRRRSRSGSGSCPRCRSSRGSPRSSPP